MHLTITQVGASDLLAKNADGFSDSYCIIVCDSNTRLLKTHVRRRTLNPRWDTQFDFTSLRETASVTFTIYNSGAIGADSFLGYAIVPIHALSPSAECVTRSFPLAARAGHSGRVQGTLQLTYRLVPVRDACCWSASLSVCAA